MLRYVTICFIFLCGIIFSNEDEEKTISTYSLKSHKLHKVSEKDIKERGLYIISDNDFINPNYTFELTLKFIRKYFTNNKLSDNEIEIIYEAVRENKISVILLLTKIETESSLISGNILKKDYEYRKRFATGYDMYATKIRKNGTRYKPTAGFENQINGCAKCLRYWYDKFYPGKPVWINLDKNKIYPKNAATYAIYKYCPFYGDFIENGAMCSGNELVRIVFNMYKENWNKMIKE